MKQGTKNQYGSSKNVNVDLNVKESQPSPDLSNPAPKCRHVGFASVIFRQSFSASLLNTLHSRIVTSDISGDCAR